LLAAAQVLLSLRGFGFNYFGMEIEGSAWAVAGDF
jgi:hypothetical protein